MELNVEFVKIHIQ